MGFFSGGGTSYTSDSYSGLRGLGSTAQDMANFLVPQVKQGAQTAYNLFANPSSYLDANGLFSQQSAMFPSVVSMIANKMSAGAGARGQLSPENVGSIAGSAATNAAPFLLPLIGQNIMGLQQTGGNVFSSLLNTGAGALGQESHMSGKTTAPGIGYNWANSFGNNLFGEFGKSLGTAAGGGAVNKIGAMCWIAEELFGVDDVRTHAIRAYLTPRLHEDSLIGQFARWYTRSGQDMASRLRRGDEPREPWRAWFNYLYRLAQVS